MILCLLVALLVAPGVAAVAVVAAAEPWLARRGGQPARSCGERIATGGAWWTATGPTWAIVGFVTVPGAEAIGQAFGTAAGWAAAGGVAISGWLIAAGYAAALVVPAGEPPARRAVAAAVLTTVWGAMTVGSLYLALLAMVRLLPI